MLIKQRGKLFKMSVPTGMRIVYVWGKGLGLFATHTYKEGSVISTVKGHLVDASTSTPEAIQVTEHTFIDTKYLVAEDFMNHDCEPNARIDMAKRLFIAVGNIRKGEEITFNYLTTEWDMVTYGTDFACACGSKRCFGHIRGFKYLSASERKRLDPLHLSPFLLGKLDMRKK